MINHFNFKEFDGEYLITNDFGKHAFLSKKDLGRLVMGCIDSGSNLGKALRDRGFLFDGSRLDFASTGAAALRSMKRPLFAATSLHIFVVSTACNLNCIYCQAHDTGSPSALLMDKRTAERAVDIALSSPTDVLSFEFQGGEPLLNYPVIRHAVEYAEGRKGTTQVAYSVVSNLSILTDEMIDFFAEHDVSLSTSLDGAQWLHDANRPSRDKSSSFQALVDSLERARSAGLRVGGIQTTTRASLNHAPEIVDAYCDLGFDSIFIRPLTPLGVAKAHWSRIGYTPEEFGKFYRDVLTAVLDRNARGDSIREGHASILLEKVLNGNGVNYMELRSPCGAGVGQLAYHVNGDVFTCDEGRMLYEMGDPSFRLGNVFEHEYEAVINSPVCRAACAASTLESIPSCCDCVYQPYCGTCPVVNIALEADLLPKAPRSYHCGVYSEIFDAVFAIIHAADESTLRLLEGWIG